MVLAFMVKFCDVSKTLQCWQLTLSVETAFLFLSSCPRFRERIQPTPRQLRL